MSPERSQVEDLELENLKDGIEVTIDWQRVSSSLSGLRMTENQVCAIFDSLRESGRESASAEELYQNVRKQYQSRGRFIRGLSYLSSKGIISKDEEGYNPSEYTERELRYIQGKVNDIIF